MGSGWGAMACRVSEGKGWGTVKTYTLPICKPTVLVCDNANAQLVVRAREAGAGAKSEQGDM